MVRSLVSDLYWDDRVELCGERRQLYRAGPDIHIIVYLTLQHIYMARYAEYSHNKLHNLFHCAVKSKV